MKRDTLNQLPKKNHLLKSLRIPHILFGTYSKEKIINLTPNLNPILVSPKDFPKSIGYFISRQILFDALTLWPKESEFNIKEVFNEPSIWLAFNINKNLSLKTYEETRSNKLKRKEYSNEILNHIIKKSLLIIEHSSYRKYVLLAWHFSDKKLVLNFIHGK